MAQVWEATDEVLAAFASIRPIVPENYEFYGPAGCAECEHTGYKGRTMINEILILNNQIRDAILAKAASGQIRSVARESTGLVSLREDGFYKATRGVTSLEEVLRASPFSESDLHLIRSAEELVGVCEQGFYER